MILAPLNKIRLLVLLLLCIVTNTVFADFVGRKGVTLRERGDSVYDSFTLSETTTFTLYAAADYTASIIIFNTSTLNTFINGGSVSYYDGFVNKFGITSVTLGPGSYTLGARNSSNGPNIISYELEYWPVEVTGSQLYDTYFTGVESLKAGAKLWQPFTIQAGYSYVVEGLNTGLDFYLIPASELSNFQGNRTFQYYSDYSSENDPNQPGLFTIDDLQPGSYYLVFTNSSADSHSLVYAMYRYTDASANGGGGLNNTSDVQITGAVSYAINNNVVTIEVEKVVNNGGASSGQLELSLWATSSVYAGGGISGYKIGVFPLSVLNSNYYYPPLELHDDLQTPPDGAYNITLILTETVNGTAFIVDYISFSSLANFGVPRTDENSIGASFDGATVFLPEVVLPDRSRLRLWFAYIVDSNPPRFILSGSEPAGMPTSSTASFDGSFLHIPSINVGGVYYTVVLQLTSLNPITFTLYSAD